MLKRKSIHFLRPLLSTRDRHKKNEIITRLVFPNPSLLTVQSNVFHVGLYTLEYTMLDYCPHSAPSACLCFVLFISVCSHVDEQMVVESLLQLKERGGSSLPALKKHITSTHPDLPFAPHRLRAALKAGETSGALVKVREHPSFSLLVGACVCSSFTFRGNAVAGSCRLWCCISKAKLRTLFLVFSSVLVK